MPTDDEIWDVAHVEDLWIFDKLILSKKLGYQCGPAGLEPPESKKYIVRPCVNSLGMSRGAYIEYFEKDANTDDLPPGTFWSEIFEGRHLSVDYVTDLKTRTISQGLTTEGFRNEDDPLWKFERWIRIDEYVKYPKVLYNMFGEYPVINCEFIDGNLIEVHFRANEDMGEYDEIIPVWKGEEINAPNGFTYIEQPDYKRVGFYKRKK